MIQTVCEYFDDFVFLSKSLKCRLLEDIYFVVVVIVISVGESVVFVVFPVFRDGLVELAGLVFF